MLALLSLIYVLSIPVELPARQNECLETTKHIIAAGVNPHIARVQLVFNSWNRRSSSQWGKTRRLRDDAAEDTANSEELERNSVSPGKVVSEWEECNGPGEVINYGKPWKAET